jgi:signal transduction histidine kinase
VSATEDQVREQAIEDYHVLDAQPRRELEALTELAALCAGVPMAGINVITGTQQWQVAAHGFEASVCDREDSMCARVLHESVSVLVHDARADERFRDNPFVTGQLGAVRFYASHPLTTPDGLVIGRLCVFDEKPHEVGPTLATALATIAGRIVDVLELELASRRLRVANERLGAFAGQVSHDLKNPLAAIRMSVELARDEVGDDDGLAQLLDRAQRGARRMDAMITELLFFARGGDDPVPVDVDLGVQLTDVLEDLGDVAAPGQVQASGELPVVRGDSVQLRAVLQNLVANAVKFSDPGAPVSVSAERLPAGWWVGVADRGPGIAADDRDRAFEPLVRLDRSRPGSGIGLATCRRIVEAHGGRMGIADHEGGGAVVWFELPD